ncbi:lipopolysaccharide core biosynthesis protein [bacterium BMS3Abin03]|nr:lipopolysaccharide core biosynthesis protein [bacterium BMS3Abin03]
MTKTRNYKHMKRIEIILRKLLLRLLIFLYPAKQKDGKIIFNSKSIVLFIRLNRIGDALVSTPLLKEVKEQTGCKVFVLADANNHFIFEHCPAVDEVIVYKKGSFNINKLILGKKINTVVDLHDDVSTTVSLIIIKAKVQNKFGLRKYNQKIFTKTIERLNPSDHHIIERIMELRKLFGIDTDLSKAKVCYECDKSSIEFANDIISRRNLKKRFLLGINITAGSNARFWGADNFKKLISELNKYEINYLIFTTENKLPDAENIVDKKYIYPPNKDFDIFAAGISKVDMLFTPDTSVVHIASIYKIPVFGLYVKYKTDDMIWKPYSTDFECIITEEPTLKNVTFNEVQNKFLPFLEKHLNAKRNTVL